MSQPSPVSLSKRFLAEDNRGRAGSDPSVYTFSKRKLELDLPSHDADLGQPCQQCGGECPGFMQHVWRKKCVNCGCPRQQHRSNCGPGSAPFTTFVSLSLTNGAPPVSSREQELKEKYVWFPSGISADMVELYMQSLPMGCVPKRGEEGEEQRMQRFTQQMPVYDFSLDVCHKLTELEKKRMLKFVEKRRKESYGVGTVELEMSEEGRVCTACSELIPQGSVYVAADRAGSEKAWHPQCFQCTTCNELLVDLIYYYSSEQENIFCGRHHGELVIPRCAGCDELIFSSTYTEAQKRSWHKEHFCCFNCDDPLDGKQYAHVQDKVFCGHCYNKYADKCQKCKEPIGVGSKKITLKGRSWHQSCFVCKRCKEDLIGQPYFLVDGDLHCADCMQPVAQCHGCKNAISPTVSYLQHKGRSWHAECFKCSVCRAWLVDGHFNELDDTLMCNTCYIEKVSKKCNSCAKPIIGKGIQFCLNVYHPECFVCVGCGESFTHSENTKVKEKNGEPCCQQCVLKLAKKCFKCQEPITSRHTMYKNRPFHLKCFTCNICSRSVANSEFFESNLGEILCTRCGN